MLASIESRNLSVDRRDSLGVCKSIRAEFWRSFQSFGRIHWLGILQSSGRALLKISRLSSCLGGVWEEKLSRDVDRSDLRRQSRNLWQLSRFVQQLWALARLIRFVLCWSLNKALKPFALKLTLCHWCVMQPLSIRSTAWPLTFAEDDRSFWFVIVIMGAEAYAMSLMSHATFGNCSGVWALLNWTSQFGSCLALVANCPNSFSSLNFARLDNSIWLVPCLLELKSESGQ
jgi:hypothetical protein